MVFLFSKNIELMNYELFDHRHVRDVQTYRNKILTLLRHLIQKHGPK